ncbi:MAG: DNA cytosine methyltransferase [Bryobacterales bacterium]|nr:DNA cytosine methyltransferase [Bryobacterales bacterium]
MTDTRFTFYEFFAGGGMARIGLGDDHWRCTFANEWCEKKAASYTARFGTGNPKRCKELEVSDVADLKPHQLPGTPALVWGSFPCQDLSLAGNGAGLKGERSGTFKPFWKLIRQIVEEGRTPKLIVLENVIGALSSHEGQDFTYLVEVVVKEGYKVGALVIDAVHFLPQSRPRLFIVGVHESVAIPSQVMLPDASDPWHNKALRNAFARLPERLQDEWIWWRVPVPSNSIKPFADIIEEEPTGVEWHTSGQTGHILSLMSPLHRQKLRKAQLLERKIVGTVYRRML